jgi:hypothetical protein
MELCPFTWTYGLLISRPASGHSNSPIRSVFVKDANRMVGKNCVAIFVQEIGAERSHAGVLRLDKWASSCHCSRCQPGKEVFSLGWARGGRPDPSAWVAAWERH